MCDVQHIINYFIDVYQQRSNIPHTPIPQWQINRFEGIIDGLPVVDDVIIRMIDAYFDTKFKKNTVYRFGHFASDTVLEILLFQCV